MTFNPSHLLIARNNPRSPAQPHVTAPAATQLFPSQHDGNRAHVLALSNASSEDEGAEQKDGRKGTSGGPPPIEIHHTFKGLAPMPGTVEIIVQGQSFWCHKELLYFASPFFQDALTGGWSETFRPPSFSSSLVITAHDESISTIQPERTEGSEHDFKCDGTLVGDLLPGTTTSADGVVAEDDSSSQRGEEDMLIPALDKPPSHRSFGSHPSLPLSRSSSPDTSSPDHLPAYDRPLSPSRLSRLSRLSRNIPIYIDDLQEVVQGGDTAEEIKRNLRGLRSRSGSENGGAGVVDTASGDEGGQDGEVSLPGERRGEQTDIGTREVSGTGSNTTLSQIGESAALSQIPATASAAQSRLPTRPRSAMDGLMGTTMVLAHIDRLRPELQRSRTQSNPSPITHSSASEAPAVAPAQIERTRSQEDGSRPAMLTNTISTDEERGRPAGRRRQARDARIILEEVDAADFHDLLHYIYPNLTCNITWKNAAGLLSLSQRLDVAPLQKACTAFLDTHVAGKPMQALQIAELYGMAELYREASRFVLDSMSDQQPADWALLSSDTIIKLERRKSWFLERLFKLQLVNMYRDYICHPNCVDPAHCARILDDRWRQACQAIGRFGSPQPSIVFRNLRQLETTPPLAMTHTAFFDRMFSLSGGIGSSVTKRHFVYINLNDPLHPKV